MTPRQKSIMLTAIKVFYCLICLSQLRRLFVPWIRANAFVRFLNNWTTFEEDITLHAKTNSEIIATRRWSGVRACLLIYLCISTVICLAISTNYAIQHFHSMEASLVLRLMALLYAPLWYMVLYSAEMLDDVVTMMSYQMTAMGFHMVCYALCCCLNIE